MSEDTLESIRVIEGGQLRCPKIEKPIVIYNLVDVFVILREQSSLCEHRKQRPHFQCL